MDDTEVAALADAVVKRLHGSIISSALPAHVGKWVRETCTNSPLNWMHSISMAPPGYSLGIHWTLNPDGSIVLELKDFSGSQIWQGVFRPVEETSGG